MNLERHYPVLLVAMLLPFGLWLLYLAFETTWQPMTLLQLRAPVVVIHTLWFSSWGSSVLLIGVSTGVLGAEVLGRPWFRKLVGASLALGGVGMFLVPLPAALLLESRLSSAGYTACDKGLTLSERTWAVQPEDCPR